MSKYVKKPWRPTPWQWAFLLVLIVAALFTALMAVELHRTSQEVDQLQTELEEIRAYTKG